MLIISICVMFDDSFWLSRNQLPTAASFFLLTFPRNDVNTFRENPTEQGVLLQLGQTRAGLEAIRGACGL